MVTLNPYLGFRDNAREALEFYHGVLGGDLTMSTFEEFHMSDDPAIKDRIMHGQISSGGIVLMASDAPEEMYTPAAGVSISLSGGPDEESELRGYWDRLSAGASVEQPLETSPWGDTFGMLTDRFGVRWMVNIGGTPQG